MRKFHGLALLIVLVSFSGCLNTFYPVVTVHNLVYDRNLQGEWQFEKEKLIISSADKAAVNGAGISHFADKMLIVKGINSMGLEEFRNLAFLVKIGDHFFLDMFPAYTEDELKMDPMFRSLFLKQHTIYKVDSFQTGSILNMQRVSDKLIMEQIDQKKIRIPMISRSDGSVILAQTEELQMHIRKYADNPVFYEKDQAQTYHKSK